MNEIVPVGYTDIERMAGAIVKSGLFGLKTPEQAIALMLIAQAEGIAPVLAARDYHVIQGRPALKADAILARYQAAGGKVEWTEFTDQAVAGVFSHPQSPRPVTVRWTIEDAKRAGLTGKDNWRQYPRQMLRARVVSEGVRSTYPGVTVGTYTVEEVQDMPPLVPVPPPPAPRPALAQPTATAAPVTPAPAILPAEVIPPEPRNGDVPFVNGVEESFLAAIDGADSQELDAIRADMKQVFNGTVPGVLVNAWKARAKAVQRAA